MITLAIYDVMSIQDFIFSSNKLKENLGASFIVQDIFEENLTGIVKNEYKPCIINWDESNKFEIIENSNLQAEIIYIGGGNALVAFKDEIIAKNVTKLLSTKVIQETGGRLKFAVAYQHVNPENGSFLEDKKTLFRKLKENKYKIIQSLPLLGIAITRKGETDGLPAIEKYMDEDTGVNVYLSKAAKNKRIKEKEKQNYFNKLLPTSKRIFPRNFDDLGQLEGDNYIAIVHIDGNNMGQKLDKLLQKHSSYDIAVRANRLASKEVDLRYKEILKKVIQNLEDALENYEDFVVNFKTEKIEKYLPIRPIVLNGDDITFVCNGKLGIPLAESFLEELEKNSIIEVAGEKLKLSASAGIAIVKSHFPFYRAYQLSEELCKSAKMKGKIIANLCDLDEVGNWIDFHIIQSGITTDLRELREKFYQVPGMDEPAKLELIESGGIKSMVYKQFNLLWRPWCIAGECPDEFYWKHLLSFYDILMDKNKWKRSRLKRLQKEMIKSKDDIDNICRENESRNLSLPNFLGTSLLFKELERDTYSLSNQTPYFDALELIDFYLQIPEIKGGRQ